ncbi:MAG: hypothetical protein AAFO95_12140, partial [Cyanobacteria bacterium J06600_6]
NLDSDTDNFYINGESFSYGELGFIQISVDSHHTARHIPEGTLIIYNSENSKAENSIVDYLEYAPAILNFFGLETPKYMTKPKFTI